MPFLDVGAGIEELEPAISAALSGVVRSGQFILGPEVESFEQRFAHYVGAKHCVGVASGYDAIILALMAAGVGPGDEVIVPAATFIATWLAVSRVGARPVPAAVDDTYTLAPDAVAGAVTDRTKAVLPVHLYGHPADLDALAAVARSHGLIVIDDAAQAHGALCRGRSIGAGSNTVATAFSFYPAKNLGAMGDAGAVTTNDDGLADQARMLRMYGAHDRHRAERLGLNSRLDPMQAAVLSVKLNRLDEWNERRRIVAAAYDDALVTIPWLTIPTVAPWATAVYHLYVVRVPDRERLIKHLEKRGVSTGVHYRVPPYLQPVYADLGVDGAAFAELTGAHDEFLSLPMGPHLSRAQVDQVVGALARFVPAEPR